MTTFNRCFAWLVCLALLGGLTGVVPACSDCNLSLSGIVTRKRSLVGGGRAQEKEMGG
jgi:hypothetical protein